MDWRKMADLLASRLQYHAYFDCGHEDVTKDCPYCDDVAAYRTYIEACR